ncbi:hypothetical protein T484DRAFT_1804125 [Baffinella frigidus]|nr:hypothetical protein T484DRAFT_1804125 [Cryptophyta sp. CCMP2293]
MTTSTGWDVYLQMTDDNIHWFSIVNSLVILTFLTGIVGLIMTRILRKDFARYNEVALSEEDRAEQNREMREETGWKLVYEEGRAEQNREMREETGWKLVCEEERAEQNREIREETGWKLVYGDVFRAPPMARVLAVYVGTGLQLSVNYNYASPLATF